MSITVTVYVLLQCTPRIERIEASARLAGRRAGQEGDWYSDKKH
jgi:hypothetical protein